MACKSCELACAVIHSESGSLQEAISEIPPPLSRVIVVLEGGTIRALRCDQCDEPVCVESCKTGALMRTVDDGTITFDETLCVGCWLCVKACPDGIRPDHARKVAVRCDVCFEKETAACVKACPTGGLRVVETKP